LAATIQTYVRKSAFYLFERFRLRRAELLLNCCALKTAHLSCILCCGYWKVPMISCLRECQADVLWLFWPSRVWPLSLVSLSCWMHYWFSHPRGNLKTCINFLHAQFRIKFVWCLFVKKFRLMTRDLVPCDLSPVECTEISSLHTTYNSAWLV